MEQLTEDARVVFNLGQKFGKGAAWMLGAAEALSGATPAKRALFFVASEDGKLALLDELVRSAAAGQGSAAAVGALNQKLDNILAQQQVLSQQQQAIQTSITSTLASAHLPPSSLNSADCQSLRKDVLLKYKAVDDKGWMWCLVTGRFWPQLADNKVPHVRACHIFQRKWGIAEWAGLKLGPSPDTPINVIPMHAGLEHAFDEFKVIVLPSQAEKEGETIFTVHVLDPELLQKTVYGEFKSRQHKDSTSWVEPPSDLAAITFMNIDKTPLKFRTDSNMRPAKRCFMAHALWALTLATVLEWPVDLGISVTVDSFGWRSPTFMQARERTQQWVHMQGSGVAARPLAGPIDELPSASIDELPAASIDELQAASIDELQAASIDELQAASIDELPAASIDELPAGSIDGLPTGAVGSG